MGPFCLWLPGKLCSNSEQSLAEQSEFPAPQWMNKCSKGRWNFHLARVFRKLWIHSNTRKATSSQNHPEAKEKHKHSPNSPVEHKLWAEEHCRSLRQLGSKASTPLWLWAELPTSNTEPLSGKTPLGCAWKCQRMCTKRHQALVLHRISELPPHCKCREAERNDSVRARAGTAGWPQMCPNSQSFLAPCSNFRPWERIFPKAPELPQQFHLLLLLLLPQQPS